MNAIIIIWIAFNVFQIGCLIKEYAERKGTMGIIYSDHSHEIGLSWLMLIIINASATFIYYLKQ